MRLSEKIQEYLLQHPVDRSKSNCYDKAAKTFGVDTETIRRNWRRLRDSGLVENSQRNKVVEDMTTKSVEFDTRDRITSLEDLIRICNIDTDEWTVVDWECTKWEVGAKNSDDELEVKPLFRVKAKLKRRSLDSDLQKQKELIIKEMQAHSPTYKKIDYKKTDRGCLLEVALFDVHFGKLAHKNESGEDFDLKIAEKRFKTAVQELLSRVNLDMVEKILLPVGNDLIHVDNIINTTFNGTPQDSDTRFHKIFTTVKKVLIETIDMLSTIAPVDILVVPGNHDTTVTFLLGEVLDAWYSSNPNVWVNNSPKLRKYYKFGKNGFQFTHGDREKHIDLGLIFATEEPKLWASTKYRFCQLGHFHKQKKTNYVSVDTHQGFQIQIIPSLSGSDAWHTGKGYNSLKQAKAFLLDPEEGLIAEYTYTI